MFARYQHPTPDHNPELGHGSPPPRRRIAVQMPVTQPRLTYILLAINLVIFAYMMFYLGLETSAYNRFLLRWGNVSDRIREGEYYRLLTSMFLHANLMHILLNGYVLYIVGRNVEALFGMARFALIYFLGGLSGSLASFIFTNGVSIGASGAIFAVIGAETVYFYHHRDLHGEGGRQHLNRLFFLILINLAFGFSIPQVDIAAHIGGLVGGVILAWFIGPAYVVKPDPETKTLVVEDENPITKWALPSLLYAIGLIIATIYAIMGTT